MSFTTAYRASASPTSRILWSCPVCNSELNVDRLTVATGPSLSRSEETSCRGPSSSSVAQLWSDAMKTAARAGQCNSLARFECVVADCWT